MKKVMCIIMCVMMILPLCASASAKEKAASESEISGGSGTSEMKIEAKAAVLMDLDTGRILYSKNGDKKLYPASVTKIMSLLLVMEAVKSGKISLKDKVAASENAVSYGGSQIWLEVGEQMSVDELLKAVAVASANDACTALGEYVAGSSEAFVKLMNERAKELGMSNTHFDNCTGLDDDTKTHLSTAHDIAVMSRELMKYDLIKKYSKIWMDSLRSGKTQLVNTNRLVRFYDGCTGLKTGTTSKAGFCVSATASKGGTNLCAVVLGSDTSEKRFNAAAKLLNWGFANFESVSPEVNLSQAGEVKVNGGICANVKPALPDGGARLMVEKGSGGKLEQEVLLEKSVDAPVGKNQIIGRVNFYVNDKKVGSVNILNKNYVAKLTFGAALCKLIESTVTNL